jgi:hypothetical protein
LRGCFFLKKSIFIFTLDNCICSKLLQRGDECRALDRRAEFDQVSHRAIYTREQKEKRQHKKEERKETHDEHPSFKT